MYREPRLAERDLVALFDASPNAYVILAPDLTIVGCNDAYLKVTGRTREQIVGRHLFEAFPSPPDSDSFRLLSGSFARVISERRVDHLALIPYDISSASEAAQMRFWSATHTPLFDSNGEVRLILQHTVDVTELQRPRSGNAMAGMTVLSHAQAVQAENSALSRETGQLRALFEQAPSFMAVLSGPEHVFTLANQAYRQLVGGRDVIGLPVVEALPEVVAQGFVDLLDEVHRTGEPFLGRGVTITLETAEGGHEQRVLDFIYHPIRAEAGVAGIFVQGHDITEQKRAEQALARQSEFLSLAQEAGGIGTFEWDIDTGRVRASAAFMRLYGLDEAREEIHVTEIEAAVVKEDREHLAMHHLDSLEPRLQRLEYRVNTPMGTRWIGLRGKVIRDAEGKPVRVLGAAYDQTDRKEFETQLETIAHESSHRIKNVMAVVQAMVAQTLRRVTDPIEARQVISERLVALAKAQDVLTLAGGKTANLSEIVGASAALHADASGQVHLIAGTDGRLDARTSMGLSLVLHELATNAIKYGALSVPAGRVTISWNLEQSAEATRRIVLEWRETGGPPVTPPSNQGFGSKLIERGLAHDAANQVELDFAPSGLVCTARIRLG